MKFQNKILLNKYSHELYSAIEYGLNANFRWAFDWKGDVTEMRGANVYI